MDAAEVRFRVLSDMCGLGPPLYESQSLVEAELTQGQKVIMECGIPPLSSQVSWRGRGGREGGKAWIFFIGMRSSECGRLCVPVRRIFVT